MDRPDPYGGTAAKDDDGRRGGGRRKEGVGRGEDRESCESDEGDRSGLDVGEGSGLVEEGGGIGDEDLGEAARPRFAELEEESKISAGVPERF